LDLDETLVHSEFSDKDPNSIPFDIEIEGKKFTIFVSIRPGAQEFIKKLANFFELVIFTASMNVYAQPLMEVLDPDKLCTNKLYRENCTYYEGMYVKDLSLINRDLKDVIIIDNSPTAYYF
jgi:RNA polymerase II subunit A small phosphatase-like protein